MEKYLCVACGYIYDPQKGDDVQNISTGVDFKDLPTEWVCPVCGADKEQFKLAE